jgi:3-oxoacyl-[acyl-carrier-protein] synthase II
MVNSLGLDKESAFAAINEGKCGIKRIELFDVEAYSAQIAGEIVGFDPTTVMDAKETKKADRFIQLGLKAAAEAMEDAKLPEDVDRESFGVASASGIGGLPNIEKNSIVLSTRGPKRISPFFIPSSLVNMLGGFVSIYQNLKGPNLSSVTACAAGTHAIGEAAKSIMVGTADKMLVIGAESAICGAGVGGFAAMKALSTRNDDPQTASRPFDADRDGFVMGEGAGVVVLEEYEHAKARGAKIYAELAGFGMSGDAYHMTSPSPEGEGAARCMLNAMRHAGLNTDGIDYINAHGTSTPQGDIAETKAVKRAFGDQARRLKISSIKSMIGHLLGAAGGVEAVSTILSIYHQQIPPTINLENPDPECDLDYVPLVACDHKIDAALTNSFGFGGTNGTLAFKKLT